MIPQYEFSFVAACVVVAAVASVPEPVLEVLEEGPVMARIWVIEGRKRVQRMWRVDSLRDLNGKVWGWAHIGGAK